MTTYPTDEAWAFFMLHHDNIRACCERFLPVPEFQVPNTRIVDKDGNVTDQRGTVPLAPRHTIYAFDAAVKSKDSLSLSLIMNDAWLRAPDDRRVYQIPGFTEMCDLLDFTVEGLTDSGDEEDGS